MWQDWCSISILTVTLLVYRWHCLDDTDTQKMYRLSARCWVCYLTNTVFVTVRYHTLFVGLKCGHYVHMYTDCDTESVTWANTNSQVSSLVTDTYTGSWADWELGVRCGIWHRQWQCCWGGTYTGSWADWVPNVRCGILHWCQVWYMTLTGTMVLHRWHCWGDTDAGRSAGWQPGIRRGVTCAASISAGGFWGIGRCVLSWRWQAVPSDQAGQRCHIQKNEEVCVIVLCVRVGVCCSRGLNLKIINLTIDPI